MKISIIIPIYNASQFIKRCLLSVLNQTYSDIEYVLVNDATPDNSINIIESLIQNHPRKKNIVITSHSENQGTSEARNTGIKISTGDYLFFLDSDDELPENAIQLLISHIQDTDIEMVIGGIDVIGGKKSAFPSLKVNNPVKIEKEQVMISFLLKKWYDMACNKLIKKSLIVDNNLWFTPKIIHGEDTLWSFKAASKCKSIQIETETTYYYHIHSESVSQQNKKRNIESIYLVLQQMIEFSTEQQLFKLYGRTLSFYLEKQRIYLLKLILRGNFSKEYVKTQWNKINLLYLTSVRKFNKRPFIIISKDFVLNSLRLIKYRA